MNNGIETFRSQLQKELGLSIGPKDPIMALWVSQKDSIDATRWCVGCGI